MRITHHFMKASKLDMKLLIEDMRISTKRRSSRPSEICAYPMRRSKVSVPSPLYCNCHGLCGVKRVSGLHDFKPCLNGFLDVFKYFFEYTNSLITNYLVKIGSDSSSWDLLYQDPYNGCNEE